MYYVVYDDFLNDRDYGALKAYLSGGLGFPWNYSSRINDNDKNNDDFYFAQTIYTQHQPLTEQWNRMVDAQLFSPLIEAINYMSMTRIKCNMYMKSSSGEVYHHAKHVDYDNPNKGALFYLTTCNAPTTMADGYEVQAVENRMLFFDAGTPHSSSSPTNVKNRMTINFNYHGYGIRRDHLTQMRSQLPVVAENPEKLVEFM
tara:strand:- start:312 stop:914 length:603 start_codon:yes stop_codon:yes gene_type:complete